MKKFLSAKRKYLISSLILILGVGAVLFFVKIQGTDSENARFEKYIDQIFREELSENTLNLHYTLAYPENFGIQKYSVSLGTMDPEALEDSLEETRVLYKKLKRFDPDQLSEDNQIIYTKFSSDRASRFSIRTDIMKKGGKRVIQKRATEKDALPHVTKIKLWENKLLEKYRGTEYHVAPCFEVGNAVEFEFIEGSSLETLLNECLRQEHLQQAEDYFRKYMEMIFWGSRREHFLGDDNFREIFGSKVPDGEMEISSLSDIDLIFSEQTAFNISHDKFSSLKHISLTVKKGTKRIRLDPCGSSCILQLEKALLGEECIPFSNNGTDIGNGWIFFPHSDPQIIFDVLGKEGTLEIDLILMRDNDTGFVETINKKFSDWSKERLDLESQINQKDNKIELLIKQKNCELEKLQNVLAEKEQRINVLENTSYERLKRKAEQFINRRKGKE